MFNVALWAAVPVEVVSLFLTLIQTILAIASLMNDEGGSSMTNSLMVVGGAHGVASFFCWNVDIVLSAV